VLPYGRAIWGMRKIAVQFGVATGTVHCIAAAGLPIIWNMALPDGVPGAVDRARQRTVPCHLRTSSRVEHAIALNVI
jgi:hypothetical protein